MSALLVIKDLCVRIGADLLLNGINLEIEAEETFILIGATLGICCRPA